MIKDEWANPAPLESILISVAEERRCSAHQHLCFPLSPWAWMQGGEGQQCYTLQRGLWWKYEGGCAQGMTENFCDRSTTSGRRRATHWQVCWDPMACWLKRCKHLCTASKATRVKKTRTAPDGSQQAKTVRRWETGKEEQKQSRRTSKQGERRPWHQLATSCVSPMTVNSTSQMTQAQASMPNLWAGSLDTCIFVLPSPSAWQKWVLF